MSMESRIQGSRIDEHLESVLSLRVFNYAECTGCWTIVELPQTNVAAWKFDPSSLLKPSILKVAKGLCSTCQEMRRQFKAVLSK